MIEIIGRIDWSILDFIQSNMTSPLADEIMLFFTKIGNSGFIWRFICVIFLIFRKHRKLGIILLMGLVVEIIIGDFILKELFMRPRPCWIDKSVDMLVSIPKSYSMPSGHTLAAFTSSTIILMYNRRWGYGTLVIAVLISFSRLYLYVHFPSDVFVGALLGIVIGYFVFSFFSKCLLYAD